jgi:hypothetical protein
VHVVLAARESLFTPRKETGELYNKISDFCDALAGHSEAPVRAAAVDVLSAAERERILEIGSWPIQPG